MTSVILRRLGGGKGEAFPGFLAGRIAPDLLPCLAKEVREGVIVILGTNGKTTTNNLLCHVLEAEGKKVLCNRSGANMRNGVTAAFVLAADRRGRIDADYACIEVDEFAAEDLLPALKPVCVVLTNIFRDQLDRFGEIDAVCEKIRNALNRVPEAKVVFNCDDSLSASVCMAEMPGAGMAFRGERGGSFSGGKTTAFGVNERLCGSAFGLAVREGTFCRFCGEKLEYAFYHYGQLGHYRCPGCSWERPVPDYAAEGVAFRDESYRFFVDGLRVSVHTDALYNVYNTLSVYAALKACAIEVGGFSGEVERFDFENRREETFWIRGARVRLFLAKNPVGFQQKMLIMMRDGRQKDILLHIADTARDGTDISWLWDVDFGYFAKMNAKTILTVGSRRLDMALRLKYEDISCRTVKGVTSAVRHLVRSGTGNLYIIVNYSGLFHINRMLHRMSGSIPKKAKER